ncbi:hypothetical protein M153_1518000742 [Pseudoloma neurophilia]|uniref:Uncharacterized protein n=1 Tax=Pseudoloma neurophilia TaxID=146866 RepID=A0A0R0LUN2_9MICR|nr:hypothetical protein M153_1518000742 [Pseudoloma neurophilia]
MKFFYPRQMILSIERLSCSLIIISVLYKHFGISQHFVNAAEVPENKKKTLKGENNEDDPSEGPSTSTGAQNSTSSNPFIARMKEHYRSKSLTGKDRRNILDIGLAGKKKRQKQKENPISEDFEPTAIPQGKNTGLVRSWSITFPGLPQRIFRPRCHKPRNPLRRTYSYNLWDGKEDPHQYLSRRGKFTQKSSSTSIPENIYQEMDNSDLFSSSCDYDSIREEDEQLENTNEDQYECMVFGSTKHQIKRKQMKNQESQSGSVISWKQYLAEEYCANKIEPTQDDSTSSESELCYPKERTEFDLKSLYSSFERNLQLEYDDLFYGDGTYSRDPCDFSTFFKSERPSTKPGDTKALILEVYNPLFFGFNESTNYENYQETGQNGTDLSHPLSVFKIRPESNEGYSVGCKTPFLDEKSGEDESEQKSG